MSIFTKPLSQVGAVDLQELLQEQAIENLRLEFKSEIPDKDEMLKKLSAFANTFGGLMVVGASASCFHGPRNQRGVEFQTRRYRDGSAAIRTILG
jgi:predicted HTH transcriptional regulator